MSSVFPVTSYRYPNEQLILYLTIIFVFVIIAITATATLCGSALFILIVLLYSYYSGRQHNQALLQSALRVTPEETPALTNIINESSTRLQVEPVDVFVVHQPIMNAYTFGLTSPKSIVLFDAILKGMDRDEIQFVIGHEMGHVCLGHTWLNSLVGGMAGIPASGSATLLLVLSLRWWNRACEFSADRAGLLACGKPQKAISALAKLAGGPGLRSSADIERFLKRLEAEEDGLLENLGELIATHPMIARRIELLGRYAATKEYQVLQSRILRNAPVS